ncbi:hypothetical protein KCP77_24130 [Salmonella enterica subsp. enterica]|nr:hypothetical protein KCP77_24130 [Salmonella enterica subsp. enterica]
MRPYIGGGAIPGGIGGRNDVLILPDRIRDCGTETCQLPVSLSPHWRVESIVSQPIDSEELLPIAFANEHRLNKAFIHCRSGDTLWVLSVHHQVQVNLL